MYCGCNTCCGKLTWCFTVILLLAAAAGLAAGLYKTVPCTSALIRCNPAVNGQCWGEFWQCTKSGNAPGLFFFLAVAGAACLLLALLSCCGFCCQKSPKAKAARKQKKQDQFVTGSPTETHGGVHTDAPTVQTTTSTDQAVYSDSYAAYDPYPNVKPSVAHV